MGLAWAIDDFARGAYLTNSPLYNRAAEVGLDGVVEWGGDWTGFVDRPHYQRLPGALQLAEVRSRFEEGQTFFA